MGKNILKYITNTNRSFSQAIEAAFWKYFHKQGLGLGKEIKMNKWPWFKHHCW